jgi:hypothetical protein
MKQDQIHPKRTYELRQGCKSRERVRVDQITRFFRIHGDEKTFLRGIVFTDSDDLNRKREGIDLHEFARHANLVSGTH